MERQNGRVREKAGMRKDSFAVIGILTYIGSLIFRVVLYHVIGEKGVGYFGIANELYIGIGFFFAYGLTEAVAVLVRYRVKREQYKNAERVLQTAGLLALLTGILLGAAFWFFGKSFAEKVIGIPKSYLAIEMMTPALLLALPTGVLRGYFQGNGTKVPSMHSKILETVFVIIGGLIGAGLLYRYGEKVSALLQNTDYAPAYGAMGAAIGLLAAGILCFLHLGFLFLIYRGRSRRGEKELQRAQEHRGHIVYMLVSTAAPYAVYAFVYHCLPLLDGCFYLHTAKGSEDSVLMWGNYYGKYMVITGIIGSLIALTTLEPVRKIISLIDREEYRTAREKMGFLMHQVTLIALPAAVFLAVLAENILNVLFKGNNMKTAEWIMWGSIGMVLYVFAILFMNMLLRLKKMKQVICIGAGALLMHIAVVLLLVTNTSLGIMALIIGNIVFYLLVAAFGFVMVGRSMQYTQEWIKSVAFTIVTASVAGLMVMLLNRALSSGIGTTISLVICLPVGILAYIVLLLVTRAVTERDMENMAGGGILMAAARILHLI